MGDPQNRKKTEIKLDINLLSKTNKYKIKQTNRKNKYQKERKKTNMNAPFIKYIYQVYRNSYISSIPIDLVLPKLSNYLAF
jgi:hypothetical protein